MPRQSLLSRPGRVESLALLGGPLCLDFVNTVDPRHGEQSAEYLTSYRDLVRWAQHAGALPAADAKLLLERARRDPEGAGQAFVRAIELRDRLYDAFSALAARSSVGADALAAINGGLASAAGHAHLVAGSDGRFGWKWDDDEDFDRVWWPAARSAAEFLTTGRFDRLRECPGLDGCGWLFYDASKNGSRRWCSMQGCGNRAKARRHYERERESEQR